MPPPRASGQLRSDRARPVARDCREPRLLAARASASSARDPLSRIRAWPPGTARWPARSRSHLAARSCVGGDDDTEEDHARVELERVRTASYGKEVSRCFTGIHLRGAARWLKIGAQNPCWLVDEKQ